MVNLDNNPDVRYTKGDKQKPKNGVDDQMAFNYDWRDKHSESTTKLKLAPNWTSTFHELAEAYAKVDGNMQYAQAHQTAIDRNQTQRAAPLLEGLQPWIRTGHKHNYQAMKHRQTKIIWQRLIAALLISGVMPFLGVARNQGGQKVPAGFNYPQSQETVQVDAAIKSRSLSGVVTDPGGSVASRVLVERVRPGWGKRISAIFSDSQGRFAFAGVGSGTHFLRISKPGFNTMLLKVRVRAKAKSTLRIDLKLSN